MNLLSFLAIIIFGIFFHFGLSLYRMENKNRPYYLALLMIVCLNFMILAGFFSYSAHDRASFVFWMRVMMTFLIVYFPLSFHFCLEITQIVRIKKWWHFILYGQALVLVYKNWTDLLYTKDFFKENGVWLMKTNIDSPWFVAFSVIAVSISIGSLLMLHLWEKHVKMIKEKRQAKIMKVTLLITIFFATIESILMPSFTGYRTLGLGSIIIGIWVGGILYCFLHYRFLNLTPEIVSHELVNNISDGIVLLDMNLNCVFINNTARTLFNVKNIMISGLDFFSLFRNHEKLTDEIRKMTAGSFKSVACRMHLKSEKVQFFHFETRISLINDKFNDPLGIMVISQKVQQINHLKALYNVTEREIEIIENLISGKTNKDISRLLNITLRTVKAHITSIYMKLDVSNKVQLINKLNEYEILPHKQADKLLLLY